MTLPDWVFIMMVVNWLSLPSTSSTLTGCGRFQWSWGQMSNPTTLTYWSYSVLGLVHQPYKLSREPSPWAERSARVERPVSPQARSLVPSILEGQCWGQEETHFRPGLLCQKVLPSLQLFFLPKILSVSLLLPVLLQLTVLWCSGGLGWLQRVCHPLWLGDYFPCHQGLALSLSNR